MSSEASQLVADGSAEADSKDEVEIDRSIDVVRWRYTCPKGHSDWYPTNNHVWCKGCRRAIEAGHDDLEAEYHEILDQRSGETIHWSRIKLVDADEKQISA